MCANLPVFCLLRCLLLEGAGWLQGRWKGEEKKENYFALIRYRFRVVRLSVQRVPFYDLKEIR